ncbi:MAG: phage shock protein C [Luteibaculaceae bacterium]|jgi:phage shock protein C
MIPAILNVFEKNAFGVCAWWSEKLGISSHRIRLIFIYMSFLTVGTPLVLYSFMAGVLEIRWFFKRRYPRKTIWDI